MGRPPGGAPLAKAGAVPARRPGHRGRRVLQGLRRRSPRSRGRTRCTPGSSSRGISASIVTARRVLHLEISLGYQHRGVEAALRGSPHQRSIHSPRRSPATPASATRPPIASWSRRYPATIVLAAGAARFASSALELERIANHIGDLGALAGDVGFLPAAAYCGRLRGDVLNLTALLCGSRLGRGWIRPGGVARRARRRTSLRELRRRLGRGRTRHAQRGRSAMEVVLGQGAVREYRHAGRGRPQPISAWSARRRARAASTAIAAATFAAPTLPRSSAGHCGRRRAVMSLPARIAALAGNRELAAPCWAGCSTSRERATPLSPVGALAPNSSRCRSSRAGAARSSISGSPMRRASLSHYKIVDPSFRNWFGLAMAMRGQAISDFPLCNKSFNLSYCGHDL